MKTKDVILIVAISAAIFSTSYLLKYGCRDSAPGARPDAPASAVTPITDQKSLDTLPPLPNNEKPVSAIPVPVPSPEPGKIIKTSVVVSSQGNTYIVYAERIDWGFRFETKAAAGISTDLLAGVDVTIFSYWRLNADVLAFIPLRSDLDFTRARAGAGISAQISQNTSTGVAYLIDLNDRRTWAVFAALKF